jgi:hypothetical protein
MEAKGPRPCCICGMEFTEYGNNPEPFEGEIGMCCNDCNDRWVVPVRIIFGRDGMNHRGAPLALLKRIAEMAAQSVVNTKQAREWWEANRKKKETT